MLPINELNRDFSPKNLFAAFRLNPSKRLITFTVTHTNKYFVFVITKKDDITHFAHSSNEMFNFVMITTTLQINSRRINIKVVKRNQSLMDYQNTALRDVVNDIVPKKDQENCIHSKIMCWGKEVGMWQNHQRGGVLSNRCYDLSRWRCNQTTVFTLIDFCQTQLLLLWFKNV